VTYRASSDAKKTTARAMSSGSPIRRSAIDSMSRRWPASPIACHCRSDAGFERTKPGATQLTRIPYSPSSRAVWRVKPISPALALA
jgi:hypothetical protein